MSWNYDRVNLWRLVIGFYYLMAFMFRPGRTSQWPLELDTFLLFGIAPGAAAICGLFLYKTSAERALIWLLFGLAIAGAVFSWLPFRHAISGW